MSSEALDPYGDSEEEESEEELDSVSVVADRAGCRDRLSGGYIVLLLCIGPLFVCVQVTRTPMQQLIPIFAFPLSSLRSVERLARVNNCPT